jgi:hypothetical protein
MAVAECARYWRLIVGKGLGFMPSLFYFIEIYVEGLVGGSHFEKSISWGIVFRPRGVKCEKYSHFLR